MHSSHKTYVMLRKLYYTISTTACQVCVKFAALLLQKKVNFFTVRAHYT